MEILYTATCRYEIQEKKKFRHDIPAYTGPFRALHVVDKIVLNFSEGKAVPQHTYGSVGGGERIYGSILFLISTLDGENGQCHALATLYPWGKEPWYPLYRRLGGPQSRCGHRG
jgi:hypothetical protein